MELQTITSTETTQETGFISFFDAIFYSSDMYISFGIHKQVKKLIECHGAYFKVMKIEFSTIEG